MRNSGAALLAIAGLTLAAGSAHALGERTANMTRVSLAARHAAAIPPWARKYNVNCRFCHYPTVPRLNATGLAFKWAGYRTPDEIGKSAEVKKMEDYVGARGIAEYRYTKTERVAADTNTLNLPSASLFLGGALGKNFGTFLEFERTPDAAIDLVAMFTGVWGKENGFGGVRVGQGHMIVGGAVAGFDRPTGILAPLPLESPATPGVPFSFTGDVAGAEAFYVLGGMNRASVEYVNGLAPGEGGMEVATTATTHDWVLTDQFVWDDAGLGLAAVGYFGSVRGLDPAQPDLRSKYQRLGLTGNKFIGPFEAQAGYVYSNNSNLPSGSSDSMFPSASVSGNGYWLYGGYTTRPSYLTVYGRYDTLDPNRAVSADALHRVVVGSVLPVNVPEYLRLGLEYFIESPQASGAPKRQGVTGQIHIAF